MKINFFPFFKRTKRKDPVKKSVSAGDEYQKRIHEKNLSKINERVDVHVKRFARNHRAVVKESDLAVLHDATKRISSEDISRFLYRRDAEELSLFFQQNGVCLRRKNAFFILTSITCFPSGQAKIQYRTKDKHHRIIEHEETL